MGINCHGRECKLWIREGDFWLFIAAAYCLMGQMYGQQDNETPFTLLDDRSAKTAKIAQTRIPPKKDWIAMKSEREKKN